LYSICVQQTAQRYRIRRRQRIMEAQTLPAVLGLILFKRNPAKSGCVRNFPYFPTVSYLRLSAPFPVQQVIEKQIHQQRDI
jgi:hypothetical protein